MTDLRLPQLPESLDLKTLIRKLNQFHRTLPPLPYDTSKGSDVTAINRQPTGDTVMMDGWSATVLDYFEVAPFRVLDLQGDAVMEIT